MRRPIFSIRLSLARAVALAVALSALLIGLGPQALAHPASAIITNGVVQMGVWERDT